MATKKESSHIATGVGLAVAAVATAAGAYFLYGSKDAKKNRTKVSGWALKAKGEVLEKIEKLKEVTEGDYHKVVDGVIERYKAVKTANPEEVAKLLKELKGYWNHIKKDAAPVVKKAKKAVKKVLK